MKRDEYEAMASKMDAPGDSAAGPGADGVVLTRASDIPMAPINWLWPGWLARGKLHLLAGAPGQGKTMLAMSMAATVSSGGVWPDGVRCDTGNALIWTCEDDPADTLNPRLAGTGTDLTRVHYVSGTRIDGRERPFDPATDMARLTEAAQSIGDISLIVVDPVVSVISGDSHHNAEVRNGLQPLVSLAEKLGAVVLGITHLSKGSAGRDPVERVIGSVAFAALARVVLLAAKVKGDDGQDKRLLVRGKSNIGIHDGGFEYHIEQVQVRPGIECGIAIWGQAVTGSARELLAQAESQPYGEDSAVADAADFLRELLAGGATPSKQIEVDAKQAGIAWRTVRRAADAIGVVKKRGGPDARWYWSLKNISGLAGKENTRHNQDDNQPDQVGQVVQTSDKLDNMGKIEEKVTPNSNLSNPSTSQKHGQVGQLAPIPPQSKEHMLTNESEDLFNDVEVF